MRAFFVTGTDTDVGKTTVSCALLAAVSARGLRTGAMKPVESGCESGANGALMPADALALQAACTMDLSLREICVYRFEEPVAPGVAADREGATIELERVRASFDALVARGPEFVIVEGAGGLLVPLGGDRLLTELIKALALPLLIVARPGLGTINHSLLTIRVARAEGLAVEGVIFSDRLGQTSARMIESNASEIQRASGVPYLGCLPRLGEESLSALGREAEQSLNISALLGR